MRFLFIFSPKFLVTITYMLQSSEYKAGAYFSWLYSTSDFRTVAKRRQLEFTKPTKLILAVLMCGVGIQVATGLYWLFAPQNVLSPVWAVLALLSYPLVWSHVIVLPLGIGNAVLLQPARRRRISSAQQIFSAHQARKIAVLGSYGKTSMKELLSQVLSNKFKVAATPGNKNVVLSQADFAHSLTGNEDILLIEFGEGQPGDIEKMSNLVRPTDAVITGIAPAHLDMYGTLEVATNDILSIVNFVSSDHIYYNEESPHMDGLDAVGYSVRGAFGWKVDKIKTSITGVSFELKKNGQNMLIQSQLLGRHQIGPLAFVATFAHLLGMSIVEIEEACHNLKAYEHRMKPYGLRGAHIIDDTYNGNIEGIKAGTSLLRELDAKRKIYVTPGLVDQGDETASIHKKIGSYIASAEPDIVVLMQNSVTKYIKEGLQSADFTGEIRIESDPLLFYTNLEHFVASGDVVLMQNDWTDNYR